MARMEAARSRRWVFGLQVGTPLVGVALVLLGLIMAGRVMRERLRPLDTQTISFADIDSPAPPGKTREDFLTEVQYLADQPDRLRLLDDDLPARLATAFARHPAVEQVQRVEVLPGRRVHVELVFRMVKH